MQNSLLKYKNKPIYRVKNQIYYGNPNDKYILSLKINEFSMVNNLSVANSVTVNILVTGTGISIKSAERDGLYGALDLGEFWLNEILEERKK